MNNYLTQEKLGEILELIYPNGNWIFNKNLNKQYKYRPDYKSDIYMIIVEFNGYMHYNTSKTIIGDYKKYEIYNKLGYKVIEIPYFIQLSSSIIKLLFNKEIEYKQTYQHGFIDNKALLPSDFCYLGIERFKNDLLKFKIIENEIKESLTNRINLLKDKYLVLPEGLFYLINN
jgi:hypothetical protein